MTLKVYFFHFKLFTKKDKYETIKKIEYSNLNEVKSMKKLFKNNFKYKLALFITMLGLIGLISGTSYAVLNGNLASGNQHVIKTGSVLLKLTENYESISIDYNTNILNAYLKFFYEVSQEEKEKEKEMLLKQKEVLESQIARREKLLSNPGYVNNAPKELVEEEKNKLKQEKEELEIVLWKLK